MKKYSTKNPKETLVLAKKIAKGLQGGEILGLVGNLGSGKTVFVQGLAKALGIRKTVNSPTFVLMKVYEIRNSPPAGSGIEIRKLIHVDAYRIDSGHELLDIGLGEYFGKSDTVVVIEWADKIKEILPKNSIIIIFQHDKKTNQRIIKIK